MRQSLTYYNVVIKRNVEGDEDGTESDTCEHIITSGFT